MELGQFTIVIKINYMQFTEENVITYKSIKRRKKRLPVSTCSNNSQPVSMVLSKQVITVTR